MSDGTKKKIEDFLEGCKVRAVGVCAVIALSSTGQALAQTFSKADKVAEKIKKEVKFTTSEIGSNDAFVLQPQENTAGLSGTGQTSSETKISSKWDNEVKYNVSMTKIETMTFSDGSKAELTYGIVNNRSQEEPVRVKLSPTGKREVAVSLENTENARNNQQVNYTLQNLAERLIKAHNQEDLAGLNAVYTDVNKVKEAGKQLPGFSNNKYSVNQVIVAKNLVKRER